ncbi:2-hydroxyacid dehydrogenase [Sphaerotilus microaerophilus]|uniref:Glyoxylate/hydroxypyruvate reductase A n=1 Tax=Sphaerotilus microaerophilus TaxID=2914710 RepID=A0ABN6PF28_9BURK|nr:glyoxylate/hydroxypyruvate reductase A [Sphaerotilus sp. FB-5]BDI03616.1 glyoxylate/hydroxypyruvate reductase A [Sphaerotilus sp. FB-5]
MDILLTGRWADDDERDTWLAALCEAVRPVLPGARWWLDRGEAQPAWPDRIEIAVVANPLPGRLQGLPRLRLIQSLWAGVDRLLADESLPASVPIARMVDPAMNAAMAETALWAVLTLQRGFHHYAAQQRAGLWRQLPQRRADELTVTVLGCGQMGAAAARRLAAMGYRVRAWRATAGAAAGLAGIEVHAGAEALAPLLADSDIVVNLLPLTPATRGLIDARFLAALPPGAALVNLARGAHVEEADLLAALDSGRLGHAVLDVFATEPLPASHPFWSHPRVTLLPHVAALTDPRSAATVVAANLGALVEGREIAHRVDRRRGY